MQTSGLMAGAKNMSLDAYNHLIAAHQEVVYNTAYYVLGDEATAEQATQKAFLAAFYSLKAYTGNSYRLWLLKHLIQVCRSMIKGANNQAVPQKKQETPLNCLSVELRIPVVLVDLEGFNYQQAAQLTGVTPSRLARQLAQGRRQLSAISPA